MKPTLAEMLIGEARKHEITITVMFDATEEDGSMVVRATNAKDTIECVERLVGGIVLQVAKTPCHQGEKK